MKNKLFYLIGVAFLLCYTGTFTSCINGVDDEYLDQKYTGDESGKDDESETVDINGEYSLDGDYELKMTYNGEILGGKKVVVLADEKLETATLTLAGTMKDLSALSGLLEGMNATFTTCSPIPGEKEYLLKNVKLYKSGRDFLFDGEDIQPTRTITYKGKIENDLMEINITHMYTREENDLLGAWKMGPVKEGSTIAQGISSNNNPETSSPLWLDWGSNANVNMGSVTFGLTITINRPMNGIFNLLVSDQVTAELLPPLGIEKTIPQMIEYIVAENTGGMYASYSYAPIGETPIYSQKMSHNILRYYFDADSQLRLEVDVDFILSSLGGILGASTRTGTRAQPDNAKVIGKELIDKLRPALEKGFPCEYVINGDNMTINIEGKFLLDVMRSVAKLVNDEYVKEFLNPVIDGVGAYAPNVRLLLQNMPNALGDDCTGIKLGFRMVRTTPTIN